ncbi:MAG: Ig-like domain repeat protein, partial [Terracidiphilus sp.]
MVVLSAEVLSQNQKYPVHYSAAAIEVAPDGQADRDGNYRFHGAFTARRKRSGMLAWPALLLASVGAFAQGGVFVAPQKVGVAITQSVTVTAPAGGVVVNVEVLTVGAQNLDFTGVPGTPTCVATLTAGATCVESVTFKPTAPGMRMGAVVLLDSLNNVLGMTYLSGIGQGGLGVLVPGNLIPVAGDGDYKEKVENNVPATQSDLYLPSGVVLDGSGNLYIADTLHNMIRMVAAPIPPATIGVITTIAGTGAQGDGGDNSLAVNATLDEPDGLAVDGAGNIYIADTANNVIRKITLSTGVITTVAGNGTAGYAGDGSSAISPLTELNAPEGVTVDASGNIYIADTDNNAIRMVSAATGLISTVVGNGTGLPGYGGDGLSATSSQTELNLPDAVAFDMPGNMYIADSRNNRIREVSAGNISTFAGDGAPGYLGDGNAANAAELNAPSGVAVDAAGNVYISDTQNSAIRKVSSASKNISTLVANGTGEYFYPESIAPFAEVFAMIDIRYPFGIALDSSADVYFADSFNNRTREIQSNFAALDFSNSLGTTKTIIRQGSKSATIPQTVENDGNAPLDLTLPGISVDTNDPTGFVNAALATPPTSCPTDTNPFFAALDKNCIVGVVFAPSLSLTFGVGVSSQQLTPTIDIGTSSDTVNSPLVIELVGIAAPLNSTTVTLSSSLNPSTFGQNVTITATVTTGTGSPTGTVTFFDGATQLGTPVTLTGGVATYKSTTFTVGSHAITATYNGDSLHFGSSGTLVPAQVVNEATTTTLISTGSPSVLGASVTFTATVTPGGGGVALPLTDAVTFKDGTTTLCSPTITLAAGKYTATCSTSTLPQGANSIIATYSGDAPSYINGSSSAALAQDVQATSTITIGSSGSPSYYGNPVTFTVAVTSVGTTPATGTVNFYMAGQTQPLNATPLTLSNVGGTGEVGFTTSSLPVSTITVPDVITAIYSGDLNYSGGSPLTPFPQVVNQATTATTVSAAPNPAIATKPVAITAAVTVTQGVSTPTGNVTFTDSLNGGAAVTLACAPQPTVASPTCTTSTLAAGTHSMIATYAGDTNDAGSASAPFALTVVTETVTLNSNTNPSIYGMPVIFTVTVPSIGTVAATGTVNILKAGQANPIGTVTLAGNPGTGTFTTSSLPASTVAAPDVITASYPGDSIYLPLVSAAVNQIVNTASTSTALAAVPATGIAGAPVAITATVKVTQGVATPTGTVAFTDSLNGGAATPLTGSPATLAGGAATINPVLAPGSHSIVATYSGDAND